MPVFTSLIVIPFVTRITAVAAALASILVTTRAAGARGNVLPVASAMVSTALEPLTITYDTGLVAVSKVPGGAIAKLGRDLLLVAGSGEWYGINSAGCRLVGRRLSVPAPMQRDGSSFESSRCRCDGSPDWR